MPKQFLILRHLQTTDAAWAINGADLTNKVLNKLKDNRPLGIFVGKRVGKYFLKLKIIARGDFNRANFWRSGQAKNKINTFLERQRPSKSKRKKQHLILRGGKPWLSGKLKSRTA